MFFAYIDLTVNKLKLRELKGLGPKSEAWLHEIGVFNKKDLETIGAVEAFIELNKNCSTKPSLNFLYAMVGALENRHWSDIAKTERTRLLMALDGYAELQALCQFDDKKA